MSKQGTKELAKNMNIGQIVEMLEMNEALVVENYNLVKEQQAFQEALKKEVDRIKGYKPWKRFWAAVQLVKDLIMTIEAGFKDI
jgi:hypothetical protein